MLRIFITLFCFFLFLPVTPLLAAHKVQRLSLASAAEGLLIEDHSLPMVTLQLTFSYAGAVSDPAERAGRSYLAADLLLEGAGNYNSQEFHRRMEEKAITIGTSVNQDNFTLRIKTLTANLPEAMRLATLALTQPRFNQEPVERLKTEVQAQLRQASQDPGWQASRAWDRKAYGNHPYAHPVEGTSQSIESFSAKDAKTWHSAVLAQNNLHIAVVGDVTAKSITSLLSPLLKALPEKNGLSISTNIAPITTLPEPVIISQNVPQSVAIFGFPSVARNHPDFYAVYLMNHILGGGSLVSRLSQAIREEKGLAYYASSTLSQQLLSPVLMGTFATRNAQIGAAVNELQAVLSRYATKGATKEELQNAKNYLTGSFPLELDTQQSRASYLTAMMVYSLGDDYLEKRNNYFEQVTLEQVNRVARELLSGSPLLIIAGAPENPVKWLP